MKKLVLGLSVGIAVLALAGSAAAVPIATVKDPTPDGTFSGQYQCGWETYVDELGQTQYRLPPDGRRGADRRGSVP